MGLSVGIVGLPNVGKSTLFNAITLSSVEDSNYPFCTIEPNSGIVTVPDARLEALAKISGSTKLLYATIEFTDIAGLVKGASKGEGLGNQFLSNIRETDAIAHVVRCFSDDNVTHVHNKVDPVSDAEIINLELILADLDAAKKRVETQQKKVKGNNKEEAQRLDVFNKILAHLEQEKPVRTLDFSDEELALAKDCAFLTAKPMIYVANVGESDLPTGNEFSAALFEYAKSQNSKAILLSAKLEKELSGLEEGDRGEFLKEFGIEQSGLDQLSAACFSLLGLQTYLTTGPKETRAWTIPIGARAPQAAGVIHTDFEKGFIRANIVDFRVFVENQGWKGSKEKGLVRQEGKDYVMKDGDVVEFLFNV